MSQEEDVQMQPAPTPSPLGESAVEQQPGEEYDASVVLFESPFPLFTAGALQVVRQVFADFRTENNIMDNRQRATMLGDDFELRINARLQRQQELGIDNDDVASLFLLLETPCNDWGGYELDRKTAPGDVGTENELVRFVTETPSQLKFSCMTLSELEEPAWIRSISQQQVPFALSPQQLQRIADKVASARSPAAAAASAHGAARMPAAAAAAYASAAASASERKQVKPKAKQPARSARGGAGAGRGGAGSSHAPLYQRTYASLSPESEEEQAAPSYVRQSARVKQRRRGQRMQESVEETVARVRQEVLAERQRERSSKPAPLAYGYPLAASAGAGAGSGAGAGAGAGFAESGQFQPSSFSHARLGSSAGPAASMQGPGLSPPASFSFERATAAASAGASSGGGSSAEPGVGSGSGSGSGAGGPSLSSAAAKRVEENKRRVPLNVYPFKQAELDAYNRVDIVTQTIPGSAEDVPELKQFAASLAGSKTLFGRSLAAMLSSLIETPEWKAAWTLGPERKGGGSGMKGDAAAFVFRGRPVLAFAVATPDGAVGSNRYILGRLVWLSDVDGTLSEIFGGGLSFSKPSDDYFALVARGLVVRAWFDVVHSDRPYLSVLTRFAVFLPGWLKTRVDAETPALSHVEAPYIAAPSRNTVIFNLVGQGPRFRLVSLPQLSRTIHAVDISTIQSQSPFVITLIIAPDTLVRSTPIENIDAVMRFLLTYSRTRPQVLLLSLALDGVAEPNRTLAETELTRLRFLPFSALKAEHQQAVQSRQVFTSQQLDKLLVADAKRVAELLPAYPRWPVGRVVGAAGGAGSGAGSGSGAGDGSVRFGAGAGAGSGAGSGISGGPGYSSAAAKASEDAREAHEGLRAAYAASARFGAPGSSGYAAPMSFGSSSGGELGGAVESKRAMSSFGGFGASSSADMLAQSVPFSFGAGAYGGGGGASAAAGAAGSPRAAPVSFAGAGSKRSRADFEQEQGGPASKRARVLSPAEQEEEDMRQALAASVADMDVATPTPSGPRRAVFV